MHGAIAERNPGNLFHTSPGFRCALSGLRHWPLQAGFNLIALLFA
jgi:hypothetical protein